MRPETPASYIGNGGTADSESGRNGSVAGAAFGEPSDFDNFGVSELGVVVILSARHMSSKSEGMPDVLLVRNPFQIFKSIIGFYPVFVIHLVALWRVIEKRLRNKPSDVAPFVSTLAMKCVGRVPVWEQCWLQNFRKLASSSDCIPSHSSHITHRVSRKILYWFPFLDRGIAPVRHAWPFLLRLRLFRRVQWFKPLSTPSYC